VAAKVRTKEAKQWATALGELTTLQRAEISTRAALAQVAAG
jgi:hypothetical protein